MTSRGLFFKIMESSFQSHRGKYQTCFSTVELLVTSQLNLCKKTSHCLFLNSRPVGLWPLWRAMNEGRKKVKQREKQRGKNTYIQRQSDHFPQTIASTDWTGDKRLEREREYTPAKPSNSFSLMLQPHGAGSVTERLFSSHGQMMVVFRPQLVRIGNRDHHQVLPHPHWAQTHHWRALQGWRIPLQAR